MNASFFMSKSFLSVVGGIFAAGATLKLAGDGKLGLTAQKVAQYITRGFGAGNI